MKHTYNNIILSNLLLLLTIIPLSAEVQDYIPSKKSLTDFSIGFLTGTGLGITTQINISLARLIKTKFGKAIANRCYINYVPAAIIASIIEFAALFGWEETREYFALDSDLAFWTHYGFGTLITATGICKPEWTALALLARLTKKISNKLEAKATSAKNDDSDTDNFEEELDVPNPPLVEEGLDV